MAHKAFIHREILQTEMGFFLPVALSHLTSLLYSELLDARKLLRGKKNTINSAIMTFLLYYPHVLVPSHVAAVTPSSPSASCAPCSLPAKGCPDALQGNVVWM